MKYWKPDQRPPQYEGAYHRVPNLTNYFFQTIQQLQVLKVSSSIFNSTTLQDSSYGDLEHLCYMAFSMISYLFFQISPQHNVPKGMYKKLIQELT